MKCSTAGKLLTNSLPKVQIGSGLCWDGDYYGNPVCVDSIAIQCDLSGLQNRLEEIENQDDFIGWPIDPIEQLGEVLGKMTDPKCERIPPCLIYYMRERLENTALFDDETDN